MDIFASSSEPSCSRYTVGDSAISDDEVIEESYNTVTSQSSAGRKCPKVMEINQSLEEVLGSSSWKLP